MLNLKFRKLIGAVIWLASASSVLAETTVSMNMTIESGVGQSVGTLLISETPYGLLFTPNLHGLTAGAHGLHVHQNPSCEKNGMAAGGHFDPQNSGSHLGPYNDKGHFGDLPIVTVNADGTATTPVLAPRIRHITEINNLAIMIHNGGDTYSDVPNKLGGGGARMVCGVIQ
ncbi:MAG: superoxide dismutase [Cu-Zn] SodC [Gammaproteobacteria bacterium]|nr:superoxide dismutase [Cu-Zn] SodC [Gammaproteobacteria bacterium]